MNDVVVKLREERREKRDAEVKHYNLKGATVTRFLLPDLVVEVCVQQSRGLVVYLVV